MHHPDRCSSHSTKRTLNSYLCAFIFRRPFFASLGLYLILYIYTPNVDLMCECWMFYLLTVLFHSPMHSPFLLSFTLARSVEDMGGKKPSGTHSTAFSHTCNLQTRHKNIWANFQVQQKRNSTMQSGVNWGECRLFPTFVNAFFRSELNGTVCVYIAALHGVPMHNVCIAESTLTFNANENEIALSTFIGRSCGFISKPNDLAQNTINYKTRWKRQNHPFLCQRMIKFVLCDRTHKRHFATTILNQFGGQHLVVWLVECVCVS